MTQNDHSEIKALSILYKALLIGQVLFLIIAAIINYTGKFSSNSFLKEYPHQIILICIGIGIAGYLSGKILFKKKLQQINSESQSLSLSEKFNDYRSACILRWALMEFTTLLCIILFFVTGNNMLLLLAGALVLAFITTRPSLGKVATDLNVSETEIEQMNSGTP